MKTYTMLVKYQNTITAIEPVTASVMEELT